MESGRKAAFPHRTRLQTSAPQRTCLHLHLHPPTSAQFRFCADSWDYLPSLWQPGSWCLTMETFDFTERSRSRSLHERPSLEGLGSTSEPSPSSDSGPKSALAAATAEAAAAATATAAASTSKAAALPIKTQAPYSKPSRLMDPSSESLLGEPYTGSSFTHKIGNGRFGFKPVYGSCIAQDPCTTSDLSSSPGLATGSSSDPVPGSSSGPGGGSGPGQGISPDSGPLPASDSGPNPGYGHDPELSPYTLPSVRNPGADPIPGYASWNHHQGEPEKQPWKFLQVSEPGVQGLWKPPDVEEKCKVISETLPRGRCLLYNWEEEGSVKPCWRCSYINRSGERLGDGETGRGGKNQGRMALMSSELYSKEVQAEQEPTRKHVEMESVTHHDYQKELEKGGPPAPTKPHDYHKEQPETFWIQRAPQLPGVSNIKTLDTPFRKNCSFSTPVPLSLGQPLPYEPENNSYQLGEISSLGCQGGGQGGGAGRTA
ncbi:sperm-associated antigen 8 isoform X3 [Pteropus medius]|uniref:sperm-associated antigen 8 isoform X3 n=1 Tax=Pteropus vampyrus TaxID=132908 RepID=UPI00196ABEEE|nr:sperm-associated antigen 8 isoform X3 [Pteropus giganteus]